MRYPYLEYDARFFALSEQHRATLAEQVLYKTCPILADTFESIVEVVTDATPTWPSKPRLQIALQIAENVVAEIIGTADALPLMHPLALILFQYLHAEIDAVVSDLNYDSDDYRQELVRLATLLNAHN